MPPKLHLKFKGITQRTATIYKKEAHKFLRYAEAELGELPQEANELDQCMAEYINCLYQDGEAVSHAGWLLSGFKRFLPSVRKDLVTAQQYYNNWIRDRVPQRAVPLPWEAAKALAAQAYTLEHYDLALMLLVGFAFFLRAMELVLISTDDIYLEVNTSSTVILLWRRLRPLEEPHRRWLFRIYPSTKWFHIFCCFCLRASCGSFHLEASGIAMQRCWMLQVPPPAISQYTV